jgi:Skp family chaperone for outer membrane proteins
MKYTFSITALLLTAIMLISGCQSTYYNAMEKIGFEKRDLLMSRVKDSKKAQTNAQEEFESAYEEFASLVNFEGGDLEKKYQKLKKTYDNAVDRADDVTEKREKVESVGKALFKEWREEIRLYSSAPLRSKSTAQLHETEQQFKRLVSHLKKAESKIKPVLDPFRDRVLFMKHNLNAQAVNSMKADNMQIQRDIRVLIRDMQDAIEEADQFMKSMNSKG